MKPEPSPFSTWQTFAERCVAVFTLPEFEDVLSDAAATQFEMYEALDYFIDCILPVENFVGLAGGISDIGKQSGHLKYFQFFDKIILVTKDDSKESEFVLDMACLLVFNQALMNGLVIKGAIAIGEVIVDIKKNICIGEAVINAIRLEKQQQWFGVAYHQSAINNNVSSTENLREIEDDEIPIATYYETPLLDDGVVVTKKMKVLNWPIFSKSSTDVQNMLAQIDTPLHLKLNSFIERTNQFVQFSFKERNKE